MARALGLGQRRAAPWRPAHETVVGVKFNAQEFQQLAAAAEAQGLPTGAYLRRLALGQTIRAAS